MSYSVRKFFRQLVLLLLGSSTALAAIVAGGMLPGQSADPAFNSRVARPAYLKQNPRVLFDELHNNADTAAGRYKPFADLMESDGYRMVPNSKALSSGVLKGCDILVIVNASGPATQRDAPAFTEAECVAVRDWVRSGGALLLISDHLPFSAAVATLAQRFDISLTKGFTVDPVHYDKDSSDQTELVFNRDDGLLGDHPITRGRDQKERINRIVTYSGTSLKGPADSVAFLKLADTAMDVIPPPERKQMSPEDALPDHKQVSAAGRAQGLALEFGKGRVVVLGEAAMLTAQVASRGFRFGMNVAELDNRQLALNIMHWLSGLLR